MPGPVGTNKWDGEAFGELRLVALAQELGEPDWKEFDEELRAITLFDGVVIMEIDGRRV